MMQCYAVQGGRMRNEGEIDVTDLAKVGGGEGSQVD